MSDTGVGRLSGVPIRGLRRTEVSRDVEDIAHVVCIRVRDAAVRLERHLHVRHVLRQSGNPAPFLERGGQFLDRLF